jgi:DNA-directed RNA polymerase, mitochondrial
LGAKGLFWLKVQLSNLCGFDKASFQERAEWTEAHMSEVYDSALKPLDGNLWWSKAENPWQALSVCQELVRAYESGNPETFLSGQPIHMDGSCNGLQHYAALGRDEEGGKQVNLIDGDRPRDVYSSVCRIVIAKIEEEAKNVPGPDATEQQIKTHEQAKLVNGLIDRKVVKQTVMTSVYGVTFIGARNQIQARLEEKFEAQGIIHPDDIDAKAHACASFVARITLEALEELFTGARGTMAWLGDCARIVAKEGHTMSWITPLGLPVSQPYRKGGMFSVRTVLQTIQVTLNNDDLEVHRARQRSAFPPNFVHSLDSTHMLLTAIKMQQLGLSFTAVHDSYWTHACDVDQMNSALRTCFVDLYSQPILEDLRETLMIRFPRKEFPEIPNRGKLDLESVKESKYFFN